MSPLHQVAAAVRRTLARMGPPGPFDVLFFAASWIDETWIRTTAFECQRRGMRVALAVTAAPDDRDLPLMQRYRAVAVAVFSPVHEATLARIDAPVVVSATNGLRREAFGPQMRHLVHMPHSLVSLHMIYSEDSFDAFDTLLACGPQQVEEFERLSELRRLPGRRAHMVGYGKLDLLSRTSARPAAARQVLIGPSWGRQNILNTIGAELVERLLAQGFEVTVRPHPLFVLGNDPSWTALRERFRGRPRFATEDPFTGDAAILTAQVLLTDYSGIALEFAALRRRPCVFVDVAKKVINPSWERVGLEPLEVSLRGELGVVVPPDAGQVLAAVAELSRDSRANARIDQSIPRFLVNAGSCDQAAAAALAALLAEERVQ